MNTNFNDLIQNISEMLEENEITLQLENVKMLVEKEFINEMQIERIAKNSISEGRFLGTKDYKKIVDDALDFLRHAEPCHVCGEPAHYLDNQMRSVCLAHDN